MPAGNEQGYRGWTEADIARAFAENPRMDVNAAIRGAGLNTNIVRIQELANGVGRGASSQQAAAPQRPAFDTTQLLGALALGGAMPGDPRQRAAIMQQTGMTMGGVPFDQQAMSLLGPQFGMPPDPGGPAAIPEHLLRALIGARGR